MNLLNGPEHRLIEPSCGIVWLSAPQSQAALFVSPHRLRLYSVYCYSTLCSSSFESCVVLNLAAVVRGVFLNFNLVASVEVKFLCIIIIVL